MDPLLDLADRQSINLGRLSIVAMAKQFVAAMQRRAGSVPLELRVDLLVLANRLVPLRSRQVFLRSQRPASRRAGRGG